MEVVKNRGLGTFREETWDVFSSPNVNTVDRDSHETIVRPEFRDNNKRLERYLRDDKSHVKTESQSSTSTYSEAGQKEQSMNFYQELDREFKNAGINGHIVSVPKELRPSSQDIAELEQKIAIRCAENDRMLTESAIIAEHYSLPVQ